jgi:hypothetical protein
LIGYESIHGEIKKGFSEGVTKQDVEEWSEKGIEVMEGFEEEFMKVEKEGERVGWMKVPLYLSSSLLFHSLFIFHDDSDLVLGIIVSYRNADEISDSVF